MARAGWIASICLACALLLDACGGGSSTGFAPSAPSTTATSTQAPTLALAKFSRADGMLDIPLLRSGDRTYADVRIALRDDRSAVVVSPGRLVDATKHVHAQVTPAVEPADLASAGTPVTLHLKRFHLDAFAYDAGDIELDGGHWRFLSPPRRASTLTSHDFDHDPELTATVGDTLVLRSEPGRSHAIPLRLTGQPLHICLDALEGGTDLLKLRDPNGNVIAETRQDQTCMEVPAGSTGLYRLEHSYGGSGANRTLFLQIAADSTASASLPTAPKALQSAAPVVRAAGQPAAEYWAIRVLLQDRTLPPDSYWGDQYHYGFLTAYSFWLADGFDCMWGGVRRVGGFMNDVASPALGFQLSVAASRMFDAQNFFRVLYDGSGRPVGLGGSTDCSAGMVLQLDPNHGHAATLASPNTFASSVVIGTVTQGLLLQLQASDTAAQVGFLGGLAPSFDDAALGNAPLTAFAGGATPARINLDLAIALRYRPGGVGSLTSGQVALFNSSDCSGAAMVVDGNLYNLLNTTTFGGSLGSFNGSVLLGPRTTMTVWDTTDSYLFTWPMTTTSKTYNNAGCIPGALTSAGFTVKALTIATSYIVQVNGTMQCKSCNLANIVLDDHYFGNVDLSGSDLTDSSLQRAYFGGANLQNTVLQGTDLANANLDGANLCSASLNAPVSSASNITGAANLSGAFLRNVNLANANLSGANFAFAGFFSDQRGPLSCGNSANACASTAASSCATAAGATLDNTSFANAYLAGTDFSGAKGNPDFSSAILVGANFTSASLQPDSSGKAPSFAGAYLMGAQFSAATLTRAVSTGAFTQAASGTLDFNLDARWTSFKRYRAQDSSGQSCVLADGSGGTCQSPEWNSVTALPPGMVSNPPPASTSSNFAGASLCFVGNQCYQRSNANLAGLPDQ